MTRTETFRLALALVPAWTGFTVKSKGASNVDKINALTDNFLGRNVKCFLLILPKQLAGLLSGYV
jgi:hypothetical protein